MKNKIIKVLDLEKAEMIDASTQRLRPTSQEPFLKYYQTWHNSKQAVGDILSSREFLSRVTKDIKSNFPQARYAGIRVESGLPFPKIYAQNGVGKEIVRIEIWNHTLIAQPYSNT